MFLLLNLAAKMFCSTVEPPIVIFYGLFHALFMVYTYLGMHTYLSYLRLICVKKVKPLCYSSVVDFFGVLLFTQLEKKALRKERKYNRRLLLFRLGLCLFCFHAKFDDENVSDGR